MSRCRKLDCIRLGIVRQKAKNQRFWIRNGKLAKTKNPKTLENEKPKIQNFTNFTNLVNLKPLKILKIKKRQLQGSNLRGQSPTDFKSVSLTTRTRCHSINTNQVLLGLEPRLVDSKSTVRPLHHKTLIS